MTGTRRLLVGRWCARSRTPALLSLGFAALTTSLPSLAQPEALYLRTLAANCAQCHGTDGHPVAGSTVAPLAGRPREELLARMKEFQAGTRPSTVMQQLARGYTDAQLEQLATYFAGQKK